MRGHPPFISDISKAFGISRQTYYDKSESLGLSKADWMNPDLVFSKMIEAGNASPIRRHLSNPTVRETIARTLSTLL
jgi:hypothetical protein